MPNMEVDKPLQSKKEVENKETDNSSTTLERLRIEIADNGFVLEVCHKIPVKRPDKKVEDMKDGELVAGMVDYKYDEKEYVAKTKEELTQLVMDALK